MSGEDKPGAERCKQLIAAIPRSRLVGAEDGEQEGFPGENDYDAEWF